MADNLRPLDGDPSREMVESMFDLNSDEWILAAEGCYGAAAGEAMTGEGANWQRVVLLEWPGRVNKTEELRTVRLMMSPEDAVGLADVLRHAGEFLLGQRDAS